MRQVYIQTERALTQTFSFEQVGGSQADFAYQQENSGSESWAAQGSENLCPEPVVAFLNPSCGSTFLSWQLGEGRPVLQCSCTFGVLYCITFQELWEVRFMYVCAYYLQTRKLNLRKMKWLFKVTQLLNDKAGNPSQVCLMPKPMLQTTLPCALLSFHVIKTSLCSIGERCT